MLSDHAGYVTALIAPAACYTLLVLFALGAARDRPRVGRGRAKLACAPQRAMRGGC